MEAFMSTVEHMTLGLPIADDYAPSYGELDNLAYLTCKYTIGWGCRVTDLKVCLSMAGGQDNIVGDAGISRFVSVICDYLHDHICGEPEDPTPAQLFSHIKPLLVNWYQNSTVASRSDTSSC
jgi:hypothetical protein